MAGGGPGPFISWVEVVLVLVLITGALGLAIDPWDVGPESHDSEETLAFDTYLSWTTDLGEGGWMSYSVEVPEGGPVDVLVLSGDTYPPPEGSVLRYHIGVAEAHGRLDGGPSRPMLVVDNTNAFGIDPSGAVVVRVSYEAHRGDERTLPAAVFLVGVFLPLLVIATLRMDHHQRSRAARLLSGPETPATSADGDAASGDRPATLDPVRYVVLERRCPHCGIALVMDRRNAVSFCPFCGMASPPRGATASRP